MRTEHKEHKFKVVEGGQQDIPRPEEGFDPGWESIDMAQYEKHTLPTAPETLEKIEAITILAGSHGQGENKDLLMHVKPAGARIWYVVLDHQETVHQGSSLLAAIDAYNRV